LSLSDTKALAQKFAPIVYIHSKDDSRPSSVDWYLKRVRLCFKNDDDVVLKEGEITFNNLVEQNREGISSAAREFDSDEFIWYLRITDSKVRQGEEIKDGKVQASCYVHVRRAKNSEDIDIQYWFFYPYNGDTATIGSTGTHDADWEHITVRLDSSGRNIKAVCYAGYGENEWCENDECQGYIVWHPANKFDTGDNPSIAVTPSGRIIEVHNGSGDNNNLYYRTGAINGDTIVWEKVKGTKYDSGNRPSLTLTSEGTIIEVHNGGDEKTSIELTGDARIVDVDSSGNNNLYSNLGLLRNTAFPVVYSAKHSHASYWDMDDHVRLYGLAEDKTDKGPLWDVSEHLVLLHDNPSEDTDNAWNRFSGHWGDSEGKAEIETPSPETIGFKGSWCNDKD